MTSAPTTPIARPDTDHHEHLRLRLKPKGPVSGRVDGGWWPRSRDLAGEMPALLAVLAVRLGTVENVSYHLDEWGPTARQISVDGARVRLAGYRSQHPGTLDVAGVRHRVTLLVVPPEATPPAAHSALMAAGQRGNTDEIDALLLVSAEDLVGDRSEPQDELDGAALLPTPRS